MRPIGTNNENGTELSEMFIGEDGKLSTFMQTDEVEVVGGSSSIFGDSLICKMK